MLKDQKNKVEAAAEGFFIAHTNTWLHSLFCQGRAEDNQQYIAKQGF